MYARTSRIRACAPACVALAVTCSALADSTPDLRFTLGSGAITYSAREIGSSWSNGNGTFGFAGTTSGIEDSPSNFAFAWNLMVGHDPFILGNIMVINTTTVSQDILVDITVPTGVGLSASLVGGSIAAAVTDLNGNGATLSSAGSAGIFTALTDVGYGTQAVASTLLTSASVTAGSNMSASLSPASFGDPFPSQLHGLISENITIRFRFTLTAGDAASFTSIFKVEAVPAPGAALLLGFAGLTAGRRRRR